MLPCAETSGYPDKLWAAGMQSSTYLFSELFGFLVDREEFSVRVVSKLWAAPPLLTYLEGEDAAFVPGSLTLFPNAFIPEIEWGVQAVSLDWR
jgi:hypothetical protein